jgi:BirA family biotin operon repressor/biotin-[acetyl-CoA-carboxylase] ligase
MFDAEEIRAATFVRHIEIHDTLGSTNDRAAELARDSTIELPALVVARHQTAGKGRGRNKWWAGDGALTFSLLLDQATTGVQTASWPQLSLATAVAVCDALTMELNDSPWRAGSSTTPGGDAPARYEAPSRLGIKWPNDVLLDGGKVCGILIESPGGTAPAKNRLIIGIGINVNNSVMSASDEIQQRGIALCDFTAGRHDLRSILNSFLQAIEVRLGQVRSRSPDLHIASNELCVLSGHSIRIETAAGRVRGKCVAIASDGALIVETAKSRTSIYAGSVKFDK